ncbi:hypothetical protein MdSGHV034 [Musca domestica salivary gland hypertrophy virus]|uniref:Uncharacterized protein n=1 Tax=Musca hytrovirus(isolate Musca domestica/United States/Boucias/-) TaxID=523909 RepID=B2YG11_MHVB|nr:hypothetical protein MdSGHV034 [Musca domestica salivary gland hypertrophy virus]ACD03493.1 hypothetical protein MdSGHV034 [Musca domestica salivary gland hypertrophy virus]
MDFEANRETTSGSRHLFRILISFGILLATSIVVIIVFVARKDMGNRDYVPIKPDVYTPPTLLAK